MKIWEKGNYTYGTKFGGPWRGWEAHLRMNIKRKLFCKNRDWQVPTRKFPLSSTKWRKVMCQENNGFLKLPATDQGKIPSNFAAIPVTERRKQEYFIGDQSSYLLSTLKCNPRFNSSPSHNLTIWTKSISRPPYPIPELPPIKWQYWKQIFSLWEYLFFTLRPKMMAVDFLG